MGARIAVLLVMLATASVCGQINSAAFPGTDPGTAQASLDGKRLVMRNNAIAATWEFDGSIRLVEVRDALSGANARGGNGPGLIIAPAIELRLSGEPALERIAPQAQVLRIADRIAGWKASASLASADGRVTVRWEASLRDGSNYIRQRWTIRADKADLPALEITVFDLPLPEAKAAGMVEGVPLVSGNFFLACEHPMARNRVEGNKANCSAGTFRALAEGESCTRSSVIGVAPAGQMRRAFLYYLERERPRPYKPFLHYNSWYDIAWGDRKMDEKQCLDAIEVFGRELVQARHVQIDSFVFDDGWDDNATLWRFHKGFPRGFAPLRDAATKYGSAVGVWLSPWGGYGKAKEERLAYGRKEGFETNRQGFSLAGSRYYGRFRNVCVEMIDSYGVNYFKFDGIAQGISHGGAGAAFAADVEGLLRLMADLRARRPDVFINITTGTWPSPFWLMHGDSIWRNGGDMGFAGVGSKRQQWITYRDAIEYEWIVRRSGLYPINSLMTQGIAQSRLGDASKLGEDLREFQDEVRSFFASGTQLQELYIRPQMLSAAMWDVLAEGAAWSRRNADVLVDVHWVGGDPGKGQVYGFAAWNPRKGMLALRNPSQRPATLAVDLGRAFELPENGAREYRLYTPWKGDASAPLRLKAGTAHEFQLAPFQVMVFDAVPAGGL